MGLPERVTVALVGLALASAMAGCVIRFESEDEGDQEVPPELREDPGWPPVDEATIRPGTVVLGPAEQDGVFVQREQCTAAFIFSDPNNTTYYVSTGAHCFAGATIGDTILLAGGDAEGTLVYCSYATEQRTDECPPPQESDDPFNDFALIEVSEQHRPLVHPAILLLGGPTGFGKGDRGDAAFLYANSAQRDESPGEGPEEDDLRRGRVWDTDETTVFLALERDIQRGDSGSPVVDGDGQAIGVLQFAGQFRDCPGDEQDLQGGTDLAYAVEQVHEHTDLEVLLATWPLFGLPEAPPMPENVCA